AVFEKLIYVIHAERSQHQPAKTGVCSDRVGGRPPTTPPGRRTARTGITSPLKEFPMASHPASSGSARPARIGLSILLSFSLLTLPVNAARACTSVLLPAQDGGFVYGRTMEFGLQMNSQLMIVPRN